MDEIPAALFALGMTLEKLQEHLSSDAEPTYDVPHQTSLEAYEGVVDGLLAMSCHPVLGPVIFLVTASTGCGHGALPSLI